MTLFLLLIATAFLFMAIITLGIIIPVTAEHITTNTEGFFMTADDTKEEPNIVTLGSQEFELDGELPQLITFLNKTLKYRGFIFGLTRSKNRKNAVTIYEVLNFKP